MMMIARHTRQRKQPQSYIMNIINIILYVYIHISNNNHHVVVSFSLFSSPIHHSNYNSNSIQQFSNARSVISNQVVVIAAKPPLEEEEKQQQQSTVIIDDSENKEEKKKKKKKKKKQEEVVVAEELDLDKAFNVVLTHCTADFDTLASAMGLAKLWSTPHNTSTRTNGFDNNTPLPTYVVLPRGAHPSVHRFLALHEHLFPIRTLKSLT